MGEQRPRGVRDPWRWVAVAIGLAVVSAPGWTWTTVGDPPTWVAVASITAVGLAMVCVAVAAVLKSRAEGVSVARTVGHALWAPIRFLLDWTV